ncbi:MAG: restriction endonuclease subunit S [Bacteroidetes bacterium]|nr:restriction endonuclease subunit S [Bacteroidota bacterium]
MADWKKFKVLEFASLVGGGTPDTKNSRYWEGDISWICPSDLTGYTNVYISKGANSITSAGLQNSSAKMLPKETVLVSSRAPVGYVAIAANPLCTNQGFRSLIIKEKVADPKFIYYSLKVYRSVLEAFASGATFPELSGSSFKKIEIPLPLLPEQQRIASILSAYDDLIENNNKRIALLEQTAEQIYKEWFVRMRFPGYANAEFEKGLPKWEITPLSAILKLISGYAFKGDDFLDTPTKMLLCEWVTLMFQED